MVAIKYTNAAGMFENGLQAYNEDTGAITARTITAPAAGISISNGNGVSGNPTLALADDLAALEGMSGTGIAVHTGASTWTERTITAGTGVSITNGDGVSGNPTINAVGGGLTWVIVTDASATLAANQGVIANRGTLVTLTLPAVGALGDVFRIVNVGAGFFTIAQNASDQIRFGNQTTTAGVTGSVTATALGDAIEIVCQAANTYLVLSSVGNFTIA